MPTLLFDEEEERNRRQRARATAENIAASTPPVGTAQLETAARLQQPETEPAAPSFSPAEILRQGALASQPLRSGVTEPDIAEDAGLVELPPVSPSVTATAAQFAEQAPPTAPPSIDGEEDEDDVFALPTI